MLSFGNYFLGGSPDFVLSHSFFNGKVIVIMSYEKKIICLANSRKMSGRCIAGKEVLNGHYSQWIRPVSHRDTGEISEEEQRFEDGDSPQVLDIISIIKNPLF